jgi:hypothetical protein
MKARIFWIAGATVAVAGAGWFFLAPSPDSKPHEAGVLPEEIRAEPATLATLAMATAAPPPVAPPVVAPPPADTGSPGPPSPAADEAAVMGMYQNMADAVDAYGDACGALGQAFGVFVSDGTPATTRLVSAHKAKGEDFTAWLQGAHGPQLDQVKAKLKEALSRCGSDPGLRQALTALAQLS